MSRTCRGAGLLHTPSIPGLLHFPHGPFAAEPTAAAPLSFQLIQSPSSAQTRFQPHFSLQQYTDSSLSPYNEKRRATDLRREKSAKQSTAAVARFLLKPAVIAMIGFLPELLAAAEGLNIILTKELPNPGCTSATGICAEAMEHAVPPAPRTYHPSCCVYLLGKNAPMLRSHLLRKCRQTRADKK